MAMERENRRNISPRSSGAGSADPAPASVADRRLARDQPPSRLSGELPEMRASIEMPPPLETPPPRALPAWPPALAEPPLALLPVMVLLIRVAVPRLNSPPPRPSPPLAVGDHADGASGTKRFNLPEA